MKVRHFKYYLRGSLAVMAAHRKELDEDRIGFWKLENSQYLSSMSSTITTVNICKNSVPGREMITFGLTMLIDQITRGCRSNCDDKI